MRSPSSTPPNLLTFQDKAIDNPKGIKNIPNNCSSTIGKVSQAKKKSDENYTDYLTNPNSFSPHQQAKNKLN